METNRENLNSSQVEISSNFPRSPCLQETCRRLQSNSTCHFDDGSKVKEEEEEDTSSAVSGEEAPRRTIREANKVEEADFLRRGRTKIDRPLKRKHLGDQGDTLRSRDLTRGGCGDVTSVFSCRDRIGTSAHRVLPGSPAISPSRGLRGFAKARTNAAKSFRSLRRVWLLLLVVAVVVHESVRRQHHRRCHHRCHRCHRRHHRRCHLRPVETWTQLPQQTRRVSRLARTQIIDTRDFYRSAGLVLDIRRSSQVGSLIVYAILDRPSRAS